MWNVNLDYKLCGVGSKGPRYSYTLVVVLYELRKMKQNIFFFFLGKRQKNERTVFKILNSKNFKGIFNPVDAHLFPDDELEKRP